ncbi:MAG TPA: HEAT repeat domain-containing protein [Gemmataceae bacterium]|nr:HEAT repeat domain-containing protein [Gemmataceae bacterium]
MTAPRLLGLFLMAALIAALAAVTAAPAQVKLPIQIKPGFPPTGPAMPKAPPTIPSTPVPKTPTPSPGTPSSPSGFPSIPSVSGPAGPAAKKDDAKWPKEINGKTVETVVKEMRSASDPAVREAAVRTLPLFGPKGREFGGNELVEAMTRDSDWNVRLAALSVSPTVLFGFATSQDAPLAGGVSAIMSMLSSEHMHVRFDAVGAANAFGVYMRNATSGKVVTVLTSRARESTSWQMRRAAAAALGSVGQGVQRSEAPDDREPPDQQTVGALLDILRQDNCAMVRREAVMSLIALGTVSAAQQKKWRADLDSVLAREKDKSVLLWTRTCILENDPNGVKGNEQHLDAVAKVLQAPETAGKVEACQAIAIIGEDAKSKLQDLIDLMNNPKEEPVVVVAAIAAVSTMKSQAKISLPIVDRFKFSPNEDIRRMANEASDILSGRKKV